MSDESSGAGCIIVILLIVAMVTCSGNADKVEKLQAENDQLKSRIEVLQHQQLQSEVDRVKGRIEVLQRQQPSTPPEPPKPPKPVQVESTK